MVRRIPRGRVATYGQVAAFAGFARQPRLAGYALHALPHGSDVPWHRVLNARGRVSLPDTDGVASLQRALLEREGVRFDAGRVDLDRFGWRGPVVDRRRAAVKRAASGTRLARGRTPARRRA
jgi:methylated-DNA-protein-cysteine methyltransferase-like protein